jgi:uncharacterized protein
MARLILADAGPLVALLDRREPLHAWAVSQVQVLPGPWQTCEPVLAEAFHLLGKVPGAPEKLRRLLESGALRITFGLASQLPAVFALQRRYANLPMSLADACLVRMVEMHDGAEVFTVDSDFRIYRKSNRQVIPLIFPDEE